MSVRLTHHTYLSQGTPNQTKEPTNTLRPIFCYYDSCPPLLCTIPPLLKQSFRGLMAYYPNLHVLFAQNYAYFFTCFREELKTIFCHCEQLLIRMSSIWESSCLNQIWPWQNLWISIQYRLKIKLFHLLLDFLLFLNQF